MRVRIRSKTLGGHTHLAIWINGGKVCEDQTLRNEEVTEWLDRVRPEELTDDTPEGHEPVAARWAQSASDKYSRPSGHFVITDLKLR